MMADVSGSRHGWDGVDITSIGFGKSFRLWRALLSSSRRASWPTTQTAHERALFRAGMWSRVRLCLLQAAGVLSGHARLRQEGADHMVRTIRLPYTVR